MNNIYTLEEFLQEQNGEMIYEGLLSNLFGAIFKRDMWSSLSGETAIKDEFRKIDDKLNGFYLAKVANPNASQDVRQILVDWSGEIYKVKSDTYKDIKDLKELLSSLKDNEEDGTIEKKKETSDKLKELEDKIEEVDKKYQKMLDDETGSSADLKRWAKLLKSNMEIIIDKLLCGDYDKKNEFAERLKKEEKKREKRLADKNRREAKKAQKELEKIDRERSDEIETVDVVPDDNFSVDNFSDNLNSFNEGNLSESHLFEDNNGERKKLFFEIKRKFGFVGNIHPENDDEWTAIEKTISALKSFSENIEKNFTDAKNTFKGKTFQLFCIASTNFAFYCFSGNESVLKDEKEIALRMMAEATMFKNALLGFGLPSPKEDEHKDNDKKRSAFGFFVDEFGKYLNENKETEALKNYKKLTKKILDYAKKLVDEQNKEEEKEMKQDELEK